MLVGSHPSLPSFLHLFLFRVHHETEYTKRNEPGFVQRPPGFIERLSDKQLTPAALFRWHTIDVAVGIPLLRTMRPLP
jgi:hypothetical protein